MENEKTIYEELTDESDIAGEIFAYLNRVYKTAEKKGNEVMLNLNGSKFLIIVEKA